MYLLKIPLIRLYAAGMQEIKVTSACFHKNKVTHFVKLVSGRNNYTIVPKKVHLNGICTNTSYFVNGKYN
jgi:hypothetical protein